MCTHKFVFPEDRPENYNPDETLLGRCHCGATQKAHGVRWVAQLEDKLDEGILLDKPDGMW